MPIGGATALDETQTSQATVLSDRDLILPAVPPALSDQPYKESLATLGDQTATTARQGYSHLSSTHRYQFRLQLYSLGVMRDGSAMAFHGFVGVQGRGLVALPAEVRQRLYLDEPGAQVEITEREDGVLELRPALPIPADQRWFWEGRWQQREKEVDEHVAAGRVAVHDDGDAFLDHLDARAQAHDAAPQR